MQNYNEQIARLITKRLLDMEMTTEESNELEVWIQLSDDNKLAYDEAMDEDTITMLLGQLYLPETEAALLKIEQHVFRKKRSAILHFLSKHKIAVSIVLIIIVSAVVYFISDSKPEAKNIALSSAREKNPVSQIPSSPKGISPTLSLINDSIIIYLQNTDDTLNVFENGMYDGEKYIPTHASQTTGERVYNTLSVPRSYSKGYYKSLKLPDSSYVMLSAGSSLQFPSTFTGNERKVILRGEGYFEVIHKNNIPFKVVLASLFGQQNNAEVVVTGTRLIIDAPDDQKTITTTIINGSVIVSSNYGQQKVSIGQQAELSEKNNGYILSNINIADYKHRGKGITRFTNASVPAILSMLKRFHGTDGKYDTSCVLSLTGFIDQKTTLDSTLKSLNDMSPNLNWKLNNNTVEVSCTAPH